MKQNYHQHTYKVGGTVDEKEEEVGEVDATPQDD